MSNVALAVLAGSAIAGAVPAAVQTGAVQKGGEAGGWQPAPARILTPWAAEVSPEEVLPEYPRPQFVRERWANLNGLWDYAVTDAAGGGAGSRGRWGEPPRSWAGQILVPFPLESALSGVGRLLEPGETLWYRCSFTLPESWGDDRVVLHFGAVDWEASVWVNGVQVGSHTGGYDPFSLEVTDAVRQREGPSELVVAVSDPTDTGGQARGKQVLEPGGIFYRRSSGIWQTVWLEPVPREGWIVDVSYAPHASGGWVDVAAVVEGGGECDVEVRDGAQVVARGRTERGRARLQIPEPRLWSPDDPFLYDVTFRSFANGDPAPRDEVEGYFAMRDVGVGRDEHGVPRLLLNGEPLFHFGPLDQGFWPGGLYTAPTDEALKFDVEAVKRMGGNMLRKHVKVEPSRFYYWCDRLGVMVWQDMPSPFFRGDRGPDHQPRISQEWKRQFEAELAELVHDFGDHPSIVMWVPFNEGWGQNDLEWAREVVLKVEQWDSTRLVNNASGWTDMGVGDVLDIHSYPGPATPPLEEGEDGRAAVLGEFGGLGLPVSGHTWVDESNWGYVNYKDEAALEDAYVALIEKLPALIARGLSAAVYTQTTDVEIEVNGWLTYDRRVWKIDPERAAAAAELLYGPVPRIVAVETCAMDGAEEGQRWRYTTERPREGWERPGFDDSAWQEGRAGFGTRGTPGAVVGTEWTGSEIWLRREVTLEGERLRDPHLAIHHDEDAEVYVNGAQAGEFKGYTTSYIFVPFTDEGRAALKEGKNVIAVHCRQTGGGQYIDVGIVDLVKGDAP